MSTQADPVVSIVARHVAGLEQPPATTSAMLLLLTQVARESFEAGYEVGFCQAHETAEEATA